MTAPTGWLCPCCRRVYAPSVRECECAMRDPFAGSSADWNFADGHITRPPPADAFADEHCNHTLGAVGCTLVADGKHGLACTVCKSTLHGIVVFSADEVTPPLVEPTAPPHDPWPPEWPPACVHCGTWPCTCRATPAPPAG